MVGVVGMLGNLDSWPLSLNSHRAAISPCTANGPDTRTTNPGNDNAHLHEWALRERYSWLPGAELNHRHKDFQDAALLNVVARRLVHSLSNLLSFYRNMCQEKFLMQSGNLILRSPDLKPFENGGWR